MRKKEKIKELVKKDKAKRKEIELDNTYLSKVCVYCIANDLCMRTIYALSKVPHIDQMLSTMYESTVKEYKLHIGTLEKLKDISIKTEINKLLESIKYKRI